MHTSEIIRISNCAPSVSRSLDYALHYQTMLYISMHSPPMSLSRTIAYRKVLCYISLKHQLVILLMAHVISVSIGCVSFVDIQTASGLLTCET